MTLLPALPISNLLVTSLALTGLALPAVAVVVFVLPYVVAALVSLFRRDPGGPFVAQEVAARSRSWAVFCLILSALALVAVQPCFFRPRPAVQARFSAGDASLQASITPDVQALTDTLPCAGLVIGVVQPSGNQVFGFGRRSVTRDGAPDG
jgi:hypothetical protein